MSVESLTYTLVQLVCDNERGEGKMIQNIPQGSAGPDVT